MVKQNAELRNIELTIAYAGGRYYGWQIQPDRPTIQGLIQAALSRILRERGLRTVGSSRTDTGVHAHDQHVSFQTRNDIPTEGLRRALNHLMPSDIQVINVAERPPGFSVRFHARAKHYSYFYYNATNASPFIAPYMWTYRPEMDAQVMDHCARSFEGKRCFKVLQASADHREDTETTIFSASVQRYGNVICFDVVGHHFLYHMVRNMAGALMMVGKGEWSVETFYERFATGDRTQMAVTAPAQGLHLFKVYFGDPPYPRSPARDLFLQRLVPEHGN